MVSTFSPNLSLEKPGSGDYVGTWDSPVNATTQAIDSAFGTVQSISLAGGSVLLSATQIRSAFLNFNGALPGNVTVTIQSLSSDPAVTISGGRWTMQNQCGNSSACTVTVATTVAGQEVICLPPYEATDVLVEGTNSSQAGSVKYKSLGHRVGQYWDYAGSSVPAWVSGCTKPPYLNCDGSVFSSLAYPALAVVLDGMTLPDARGRYRATLNQGTGRITSGSSTGGIDGNTKFATGGSETSLLSSYHMPPVPVTDPGHFHFQATTNITVGGPTNVLQPSSGGGGTHTTTALTGITAGNASPRNFSNLPPSYVGGITLIRAA